MSHKNMKDDYTGKDTPQTNKYFKCKPVQIIILNNNQIYRI
jgi:hypothetical protein